MYRIKEDHEEQMEIKKSRFITYLHRTESEADAKAFLTAIRRLHPDATHHCYAFIIGEHNEIKRSNDDGEPAGTAGVPMCWESGYTASPAPVGTNRRIGEDAESDFPSAG